MEVAPSTPATERLDETQALATVLAPK